MRPDVAGARRDWMEKHRIAHIPAVIVQGRYDMICPPDSSWKLAAGWKECELRIIPMAGHALSEPGNSAALVAVMDGLRPERDRSAAL